MPDADPMRTDEAVDTSGTSARIEPIPTLPIYFKLVGRRALLAGGSLPAVWKAELLVAAGAEAVVCAAAPCPEMIEFASTRHGAVEMVPRAWEAEDFKDSALAIGTLEGQEAVRFRDAARRAGVPVNVVDMPDLCDFQFGTIIARPPLLIGISTDGAAPVFGQALRARIEALLPLAVQAWAQAAKDWRPDLQKRRLGFSARRRYWEAFANFALDGSGRHPTEGDREACLKVALTAESAPEVSLMLVGAGPGDPDLVTMRAVRALQSAEVLVHEAGINPGILGLGRREARRLLEDRKDDITVAAISELVMAGRSVAWVGLCDPACQRWGSRRARLIESGLLFASVRGLRCETCPQGCAPDP